MTPRPGKKTGKVGKLDSVASMRGISKPKPGQLSFAERMAASKAEDRELERLREERLAALFRK